MNQIKIIVVEDDQAHQFAVKRAFENSSMIVTLTFATTIKEYQNIVAKTTPDIVIMDLNLPDGRSVECLTAPAENGLYPILLMTSFGNEEVAVEAIKAGAIDYIVKSPDAFTSLPRTVERSLREWNLLIDRQKTVAQVNSQEEELDAIYEHAPMVMMLVDAERRICKVNRSGEAFAQLLREKIIGVRLGETFHCLQAALSPLGCGFSEKCQDCQFRKLLNDTIENGTTYTSVETRLLFNRDGREQEAFFLCSTVKLMVRKEPLVLVSLLDVTERRMLSDNLKQSQKMEAVGRLAGGVAHDYNNMLNVITGYTELAIKRVAGDEKLSGYLHNVMDAAIKSANLTRQLLAFSRKQVVQPHILDINQSISDELKMLTKLISEDISLSFNPGSEAGLVLMDPSQIDQLLVNLVVNARDAIEGSGNITINTCNVVLDAKYCHIHRGALPGSYIRICVKDSGCGMDAATIERIFEPFFTTKELGKGTGLGLATVYGIVKQNNGEVHAESHLGIGTTFVIHLPRQESRKIEPTIEKTDPLQLGNETILVVEDDQSNLDVVALILQESGYTVICSTSPLEAYNIFEKNMAKISMLLSDVIMPELTGKELYERIKILNPKMKALFMSGYTDDVITNRGVLPEGVNFIHKPFTIAEIALKVRSVLDHKDEHE